MTSSQIAADVDRGLALHAQIAAAKKELAQIESRLHQAALEGETQPLADADREGRQFLARGSAAVLPVLIEADQIIASFPDGGEIHGRLLRLCGHHIGALFRLVSKHDRVPKDGKAYRAALREHFPPDQAAQILAATLQRDKAGIPRSRIVIPWDRAR